MRDGFDREEWHLACKMRLEPGTFDLDSHGESDLSV